MSNTRVLVCRTFSSHEFADRPSCAAIAVNPEFIARVKALVELTKRHGLEELYVLDYPLAWLGYPNGEEFRSERDRLGVSNGGYVFFSCDEKHSEVPVETRWISISTIETAYEAALNANSIVFTIEGESDDEVEAIEHVACRKVEYDLAYAGGRYAGVGSMAYLPVVLIEAHSAFGATDEDNVRKAFAATGIDPVHIVHFTTDELFTIEGAPFDAEDTNDE